MPYGKDELTSSRAENRDARYDQFNTAPPEHIDFEDRRLRHLREGRRYQFWRAALVGLIAGLMGVAFQFALNGAEFVREVFAGWFRTRGQTGMMATVAFCAVLAGCANWVTMRIAPEAGGSGIPHVKGVLLGLRRLRWARVVVAKFVGGFLSLAAGLSLGREGPTIHIGAASGMGVAERLRIPKRSYHTLRCAGSGAGLAAAFNAPLAGFLFVIEELRRELTPLTYGAALIACVASDAITRLIIGQHSAFRITGYPTPPMSALPFVAALGLLAGVLGIAFNRSLLIAGRKMRRVPVSSPVKGMLVGVLAGLAVQYLPDVAGGGHRTAEIVLSGRHAHSQALLYIGALLLAKFALTVISYSSGAPGGIFAPMLVIGAFLGLGFGEVMRDCLAPMQVSPPAFAVLGMAALFSSVVRAPLTGIVLIVEMTGNYDQLYALIVACLTAYLIAEAFRDQPIYDALLDADLDRSDPAGQSGMDPAMTEVYVEPGSFMDGRQVSDLELPSQCALVSVLRGDNEFVPPDHLHIYAGDVLVFLAEADNTHVLHRVTRMARTPD